MFQWFTFCSSSAYVCCHWQRRCASCTSIYSLAMCQWSRCVPGYVGLSLFWNVLKNQPGCVSLTFLVFTPLLLSAQRSCKLYLTVDCFCFGFIYRLCTYMLQENSGLCEWKGHLNNCLNTYAECRYSKTGRYCSLSSAFIRHKSLNVYSCWCMWTDEVACSQETSSVPAHQSSVKNVETIGRPHEGQQWRRGFLLRRTTATRRDNRNRGQTGQTVDGDTHHTRTSADENFKQSRGQWQVRWWRWGEQERLEASGCCLRPLPFNHL